MKALFKLTFLSLFSFLLIAPAAFATSAPQSVQGDDPLQKIALAIQAGNANALAGYFDAQVEITLANGQSTAYSKAQAEQVMKDFFMKAQPTSFKIMHQGASAGSSMYGIGSMEGAQGKYRVNIFYKKSGNQYVIYKLKFSND